jgi:hypothetical protein
MVCRFTPATLLSQICVYVSRSQWPCGLRRRSAAARLLRSWAWIPPGAWMFVCCECCVLSGRCNCKEPITRPEESYLLWCVVVCDLETSRMRRPWPALDRSATEKNLYMLSLMSTLEKAYCVRFNFRFDFTGHCYRAWWWEMSTVSSQKSVSCFWRDTVVQWDLKVIYSHTTPLSKLKRRLAGDTDCSQSIGDRIASFSKMPIEI